MQLTDDYGWLSDYDAARPYLQQEQRYFESITRQWSQQARQLLQDMQQHLAAVQLDDPPEQVGPFLYFSTSNPHGPDTILRRCTASGGQQVVLSAGIMQQDAAQASRLLGVEVLDGQLGGVKLSSDHRLLAYSLEVHSTQQQAAEQYCCVVRDIHAGRLLPGCVLPSASSFEWSADSSRLFYCQPDHLGRPSKVFSHAVCQVCQHQQQQQQQQQDELLFTECDPKHFVTLTRTKDWRYVLINSHAKLSSEVHLIDAGASSSSGCRPGFQYDGSAPLLVEVYGAYGQVLEADFRAHRLALLQRGWAVALAHVRGGGEGGRRWHAAGRQLRKPNSVSDLLACLQLLLQLRVTSPGSIAGHAASAGGLTLAAAVNAAPQLFAAVVLEAPFVDWAGSMCNEAAQHVLTEHEADEWGDAAQQPQVADMVARMCPYSNLQAGVPYPAMLVTAGLQDTRVPFWMPVKYVAKLRSLQAAAEASAAGRQQQQQQQVTQGRRPILLQIADDGGHFSIGQSGGAVEDIALQYAFLITATQHVTAQQAAAGR
ncbi:hypothetical protein OEZ85_008648 [Tetradesmus obliquus]|uniref:Prolyl endopeptidase n=1 Tax=Tetradesmus obliquus TaxID=3088 RepID=A0ABY8TJQ3_TETOB|nr:hypothetical protein OEZ85_008648 [Tetradesmus obliquus]